MYEREFKNSALFGLRYKEADNKLSKLGNREEKVTEVVVATRTRRH